MIEFPPELKVRRGAKVPRPEPVVMHGFGTAIVWALRSKADPDRRDDNLWLPVMVDEENASYFANKSLNVPSSRGVVKLTTWVDGKGVNLNVGKLVLELAGIEIPDGHTVDHINRDWSDNRLENLRVATKALQDANRAGHRDAAIPLVCISLRGGTKRRTYHVRIKEGDDIHRRDFHRLQDAVDDRNWYKLSVAYANDEKRRQAFLNSIADEPSVESILAANGWDQ